RRCLGGWREERGVVRDCGRTALDHPGLFGSRIPQPLLVADELRFGKSWLGATECEKELGYVSPRGAKLCLVKPTGRLFWRDDAVARRLVTSGTVGAKWVRWARPAGERVVSGDRRRRGRVTRRYDQHRWSRPRSGDAGGPADVPCSQRVGKCRSDGRRHE